MREFIKRHPWQLEIVPFAVLIIAFVVPAIYWQELRAHTRPWHGYSADQTWLLRYVLRGIAAVGMFAAGMRSNDYWERTKKFNWNGLWNAPYLAFIGWFMANETFGVFWLALGIVSLLPQALLERSRRVTPKEPTKELVKEPSQVLAVQPGEPFYYREQRSIRPDVLQGIATLLFVVPALWTILEDFAFYAWIICVGSLSYVMILTLRIVFSVSRERVTARAGLRRVSIPISQIRDVVVYDYDPQFEPRTGMPTVYYGAPFCTPSPGPYLIIEKTDGEACMLGVKDPEAFGNLIRAAMKNAHPGS